MKSIYDIFQKNTGYDIVRLYDNFSYFSSNQEPYIYAYYSGDSVVYPDEAMSSLLDIHKECLKVKEIIRRCRNKFTDTSIHIISIDIQDIIDTLENIINYPRWIQKDIRLGGINVGYIQSQNETLESVSEKGGAVDPQNEWINDALNAKITEENYNNEGGLSFDFILKNDSDFILKSVIDIITKDNFYGKDIYKKIIFDSNDLLSLSPKETISQSIDTLINLRKGNNPEFPGDGIDKMLIGTLNQNSSIYPAVFRQIYETFNRDDRFSSISILNLKKENDAVFIEIAIKTKLGENFTALVQ